MKCEICGREVSVNGLLFDMGKEERLLLCSNCYGHLFHLEYRATEENVVNSASGYFNDVVSQNELNKNDGGTFGLNGVFIPVTKDYIRDHPEHSLSGQSFYTISTETIRSELDEIKGWQEQQAKQQEGIAGFVQMIKEHIDALIGISVVSAIISFVSLMVALFTRR